MELQMLCEAGAQSGEESPERHKVGIAGSDSGSLADRIEHAREEERLALAREVHDDIGGTLTALKLRLAALRGAGTASGPALAEMAELVDGALLSTERIIRALRPGLLDQGLVAALQWEAREFERRHHVRCRFSSNRETLDVPKSQALALYRIGQEALLNVAKHAAGATRVEIALFRDADAVTLEVTDDGRGFDTGGLHDSARFGVRGMQERARGHGGWVELNSTPGAGTTVMASVPLRRAQDVKA